MNRFSRTEELIGENNLKKIEKAFITVAGCGGVGGFAIEALVRCGVQKIAIIDKDTVDITNINRQIIALDSTVGKSKVDVMKERIYDINPNCEVIIYNESIDKANIPSLIDSSSDYVVDAIDTITSKLDLIEYCYEKDINIISSMGMGNRLSPYDIEVTSIEKTKNCPLAKIMRKELKQRNIKGAKVAYTCTLPDIKNTPPASMIFTPAVAGLKIGHYIIEDILSK